jgi:hypothetical protein
MKRLERRIGAAALAVVLLGVLVASAFPDGLERVAADLGFASREGAVLEGSPFAGYETRFFPSGWAAQASAGLAGMAILYGFGVLLGRTLKRKK